MWKQGGRSSALQRAEAALSSRRAAGTSVLSTTRVARVAQVAQAVSAQEPLSSHSSSSLSSGSANTRPENVPNPNSGRALEPCDDGKPGLWQLGRAVAALDSGGSRFLKKTPAPEAKEQPEERAVSSSLRDSAALSRPAPPQNRFGKAVQRRSPSRTVLDQPRRFVKDKPQLRGGVHSVSSEHTPISPPSPTPAPPILSPSPPVRSPSPPVLSPSPAELSPSPLGLSSSTASALGEVRSLEELFPVDGASDDLSDHFQINVFDLDELEPLQLEEDPDHKAVRDEPEEPKVEEDDYHSDFESVIQTESLSQPVLDQAQSPSPPHTEDSPRSPSPPHTEHTQDSVRSLSSARSVHTQGSGRSLSPPCSELSYSRRSSSATPRPRSPEASVSPRPRSPEASVSHTPRLPHFQTPSAKDKPGEACHRPALSVHSASSLQLLIRSLRNQLDLTSHFISSSREHHARVLRNLGPPNYSYTTLEDTQEFIWKLRAEKSRSKQLTGKR